MCPLLAEIPRNIASHKRAKRLYSKLGLTSLAFSIFLDLISRIQKETPTGFRGVSNAMPGQNTRLVLELIT